MAEKDFEKDVTIGKVYKGAGGEGNYGPWQIWNFYLDDPDDKRKFTWFEKDGLIPIEGMSVKAMEFEVSESHKDGKTYLNHTVKWFKLNSTSNTPQKSTQSASASTGTSKNTKEVCGMSFIGGFVKDLLLQYTTDFGSDLKFAELMKIYRLECQKTYDSFNLVPIDAPEPEKEPEPYKPTLGPGDDYPPLGEPPPPEWDR